MKTKQIIPVLAMAIVTIFASCKKDEQSPVVVTNLTGNWVGYASNGNATVSPSQPFIYQHNDTTAFLNDGFSTTFLNNGKINGTTISVPNWSVTGTISSDWKKITWSNSSYWIKQ